MKQANTELEPGEEVRHLLTQTAQKYLSPTASVRHLKLLPINPGVSKVHVRRYRATLEDEQGNRSQHQFVTKPAPLTERKALHWLNNQGNQIVPFSHTFDLTSDDIQLVCMQDVGEKWVPQTPHYLKAVAQGLAAIHYANYQHRKELDWLPSTDSNYFTGFIVGVCFRPAWERALTNERFKAEFGQYIEQVEQVAQELTGNLLELFNSGEALTMIHTDIYPGHILVKERKPYIIDWGQTRYGSLYLDLPNHFQSLETANYYRAVLADLGLELPQAHFEEGYRLAAQFVGIRYIWWWLEEWARNGEPWCRAGLIQMLNFITGYG